MNYSCSQTVHGYRVRMRLRTYNVYFSINYKQRGKKLCSEQGHYSQVINYLFINKSGNLEFQGDMAEVYQALWKTCILGFWKPRETPFSQAQCHQHWQYLLGRKLGMGQKAAFTGCKPHVPYLLRKLNPQAFPNKIWLAWVKSVWNAWWFYQAFHQVLCGITSTAS